MEMPQSPEYRAKIFEKLKGAPTKGNPRKIAEDLMFFDRFACTYSIISVLIQLEENPEDAQTKRALNRLEEESKEIRKATDCIAAILEMINMR